MDAEGDGEAAGASGAGAGAAAEFAHYRDIIRSYRDYAAWASLEADRRATHLARLPARYAAMLPASTFAKDAALRAAIEANQAFLSYVADEQAVTGLGLQFAGMAAAGDDNDDGSDGGGAAGGGDDDNAPRRRARPRSSPAHFSKVRSTLAQLVREWGEEGAGEREASFGPVLAMLRQHLPLPRDTARPPPRVLVPGCGLGRLLVEVVAAGYEGVGSEFSFQMLFTAHAVLNTLPAPRCAVIHPWVHDASNHLRPEDMLRPVVVPDLTPAELVQRGAAARGGGDAPGMSMAAGEFVSVFSRDEHAGTFDAVATCFFVDTAPVAMEYMDVIRRVLRKGGVWVNSGPLSFHWQAPDGDGGGGAAPDERFGRSVELSYAELRHAVACAGFDVVQEASGRTTYACDRLSLSRNVFTTLSFAAVRRE
jgi:carnosine N-methyltransferase